MTRSQIASLQKSAFTEAIQKHDPESAAVIHSLSGRTFKYGSLLHDVAARKEQLLQETGKNEDTIAGERVAFLVENSYDYAVTLLTCLTSNAIAVPLAPSFPAGELRYILNHSEALALVHSVKYTKLAQDVLSEGLDHTPQRVAVEKITEGAQASSEIQLSSSTPATEGGMMLYTSGTTARPKGVLLPISVLTAQAQSLITAWGYTPTDHLLHVLPLHHIHGTVNALLTPLLAGSTIEFMYPFNVDNVWKRFAAPFLDSAQQKKPITFFTVVPTVWARMLQSHPDLPSDLKTAADEAVQRKHLRLNISGSAALPTPTKKAWTSLSSGNILLERFGMTEVGMALSCGLADEDRIDGSVGWPLPTVRARLVDPDTGKVVEGESKEGEKERSGEIQLKGPTIFREYWRNPEATKKEHTEDGWFKTGDIAIRKDVSSLGAGQGKSGDWATGPAYFIQGRKSADIIKTGGEKVSALEIERELLSLPEVEECAVVALPSEAWGQKAAAVVVLTESGKTAGRKRRGSEEPQPWSAMDMRRALKDKLVAYKIPQDMKVVEKIPRNAMGKVNKKELVPAVFGDLERIRRRSISLAEEKALQRALEKERAKETSGGAQN
ncbi:Putative AMP-dependent synthetase/ligase, AMP-binding enzyme domain, ANL domain-containing protein [Septoria linicola]|uniref:AMP-dependent synthetase/ligase, AMP-binding enzyme domain, ANL domain-containing protein n=1 Tax=Septoria linicola TaxID=215465 RepID=A0A9Q9AGJ5_9PEZI|nr:putative AMP-dependent synthetase/ligase, AMP-binding enzyme domain, ANL domain-containing protein [Septoria linicola]USW48727.1 Putative AMP-dependent synthetase/ligase, AMP-binding enzyme domain, ANL domain-containing protein [Septoria linicola]